ncbi:MAG: glycosyltransferase [Phycisphaera sp.]|nr:glycosyltransferase [Phycisphaera sp.]
MSGRTRLGVVFAGGGTGGHIQPNLAIAEALAERMPDSVRGMFVVSEREIDQRVLKGERIEGFEFDSLVSSAKPMALKPWALMQFIMNWGGSVRAGRRAIRNLRETCDKVVVVSTGGFVSPGVAQAARVEGVPLVMVNLDAVPGKANRLMQRWATVLLSSAKVEDARFERVPPIVRRRLRDLPSREASLAHFGLNADRKTLLVTGGSQGARSVNRFVIAAMKALGEKFDKSAWQVIHQCGGAGEDELVRAYEELDVRAHVAGYLPRMELALAASDACVCRGGAGAIADLWAAHLPALILPYPGHRDEHQKVNARELESAGCVLVGTDRVEPEANVSANRANFEAIVGDESRRRMSVAFERIGPANGAEHVAARVIEIAGCG